MKRLAFIMFLGLMAFLDVDAQETGYYKIYCSNYGRYMYEDFSTGSITTSTSFSDDDYEKIWKVTVNGSTATLQNLYTGHFAQTQNTTSAQFLTGASSSDFSITANDDGTYMFESGSYMHCAASQGYAVVNWWDSSSDASKWTLQSVSISDSEAKTIQEAYQSIETINTNASTYNVALLDFFTDLSCSELKANYRSSSNKNLKDAMNVKGLPTALQNIAVNVKNGWSEETNVSASKAFRVRNYQPYSRAYYWRNKLNATQFTDMNNPTGIFADSKEPIYIFVGGEVSSDCSLRVVGLTGNNQASYADGAELKSGINVFQSSADLSHLWIMYTYTGDEDVDLSLLDKLKIHIEGGKVYGFADVAEQGESEANATYKAALDYANQSCSANGVSADDLCFVVKGERGIFYFPLDTYNKIWKTTPYNNNYSTNYSIYKSIHWFDNVLAWEWGLMGFTKRVYDGQTDAHENVTGGTDIYPVRCNNLALTVQGSGNPYSTTGYTSMPGVGGVESSYNAEREDFDNWCVGHESGHNNQGLINLPSSTEASNNLFSNLVCYLHGYRMSRGEPVSTTCADYQSGVQFALRDIGSTHRMYWQLYLYYHEAKNKTDFYPAFFNALRQEPLNLNDGKCFLDFYKKACDAAEEDLTEFFRGWGFFVPFDNVTFGDYASRTLTLTQEDIDDAIASVKAKDYPENTSIIFIEDRIEESYRWDAWANGTEDVRPMQSHAVGTCGELGSVNDYVSGSESASEANYSHYSISGNTITMNGNGGVGFLVYDSNEELVAFSNSKSFTIPGEAYMSGITVKVVNADNSAEEILSVAEVGSDEEKLAALKEAINAAEALLEMVDESETKVGFYKESLAVKSVSDLLQEAQDIVENEDVESYGDMVCSLNLAVVEVENDENSKINIFSTNYYTLTNYAYLDRTMTIEGDQLTSTTSTEVTDAEKWQFVSTGNENEFFIINKNTGKYISTLGTSTRATAVAETTDEAFRFTIEKQNEMGVFALNSNASQGYKYLHCASSQWYHVVGWAADATASWWYVTLAEESETGKATHELAEIINKSEMLLEEIVEEWDIYAEEETLLLQTTDAAASFYLSTNHQETSEGPIENLLDENRNTFFHSTWSATTDDKHYLQVDLGEGNEIDIFDFYMASRNADRNNFPAEITIEGSNDGVNFKYISSESNDEGGGFVDFLSNPIGTERLTYRYFRFVVDKTNCGNGNNQNSTYDFFALSGFSMNHCSYSAVPSKVEDYAHINDYDIVNLYKEMQKAWTILEDGETEEMNEEKAIVQAYYDAIVEQLTPSTIIGDINLDGKVTIADIATMISIMNGNLPEQYGNADLNNDTQIDIEDIDLLREMILGE